MSGFFKPNFSILSDWKETVRVAFQQLRRLSIVLEDTFEFGDFDPQVNYSGMTVTEYQLFRARYLRIWKLLWFSIDIKATLAAPLTTDIVVTLPGTATGAAVQTAVPTTGGIQVSAAYVQNNLIGGIGHAYIFGNTNKLIFNRLATAAFTAGVSRISLNGFVEVI